MLCLRNGHVTLVVDGIMAFVDKRNNVNPKTGQAVDWIDIVPSEQRFNINGQNLFLHPLKIYAFIAGYVTRNMHHGQNVEFGGDIVVLQSGQHDLNDPNRTITSIHIIRGWKVILKGANKTFTYENKDKQIKSWLNIFKHTRIWGANYTAQWVGS